MAKNSTIQNINKQASRRKADHKMIRSFLGVNPRVKDYTSKSPQLKEASTT